ncbi:MAG TPA: N,N-dimethylformamidase beta subunit family domain-containing protein, partial [Baekduia sp.]|nr:N,N-dimethylformamidase beta subunit family domain-containing protein [Baekduia sp.]
MDVVGYAEPISASPGDQVTLKASCLGPEFESEVVRVLHGEQNGPGYKAIPVDGTKIKHKGAFQPVRAGSFLRVPIPEQPFDQDGFTFSVWIQPSHLHAPQDVAEARGTSPAAATASPDSSVEAAGPVRWTLALPPDPVQTQVVASSVNEDGAGWRLSLDPSGVLSLSVDTDRGSFTAGCGTPLLTAVWYQIVAVVDPHESEVRVEVYPQTPHREWSAPQLRTEKARGELRGTLVSTKAELILGGLERRDQHGRFVGSTFNGKFAAPRLHAGVVDRGELSDPAVVVRSGALLGAWDLSRELHTLNVVDVSGRELHGRAWNRPGRGVTGPNWQLSTVSFHEAPGEYGAVSLHDDDLDDAAWDPTLVWTLPDDLPSGTYAFRLTTPTGGTDHVPFVVTPPKGSPTARILFVLPIFSYLAYANEHSMWTTTGEPEDEYLLENRLQGLYDVHVNDPDADGVMYSSWKRPIMNMRPHYQWKALRAGQGGAHQYPADLHLIDWLHEAGYDVDVATDAEFDDQGADLLTQYQVVMTGTHAEYWSRRMLDGLETYLASGGRVMHMSGNSLYWVTGLDTEHKHTIEIRRTLGMTSGWHHRAGEGYLNTTGELGGTWRERGLAAQRYVGVGTAALLSEQSEGRGGPFEMQPGSRNPRAAFIVEGLEDLKLLGDFPNLVNGWGPVGFEADRVDIQLGSPLHTLVIASAHAGTTDVLVPCFEESLHPNPRADVAFFETASGGAVFATGSVSWAGSLHHNGYDNDVARMTRNVLNRFLS